MGISEVLGCKPVPFSGLKLPKLVWNYSTEIWSQKNRISVTQFGALKLALNLGLRMGNGNSLLLLYHFHFWKRNHAAPNWHFAAEFCWHCIGMWRDLCAVSRNIHYITTDLHLSPLLSIIRLYLSPLFSRLNLYLKLLFVSLLHGEGGR